MKSNKKMILPGLLAMFAQGAMAQSANTDTLSTDSISPFAEQHIKGVTITRRRKGIMRMSGAENGSLINQEELFKAACCNLGESFVTNPSVDVNYNDATTGARQIKLLGLSGTYVQMLTENLPNFRGAAAPYALGYVPGPWMKSIQVSKGSSSVRNGYESITGQINVEYLKPEEDPGVTVNLYGDTESRFEANADANVHLTSRLNTEILAHYENRWGHHDSNGDGFQDMPGIRQYNLQNRWDYLGRTYIFHGGISLISEDRNSGQITYHSTAQDGGQPLYKIGVESDRYEAYMKHAFVLNRAHNASIALMGTASMHEQSAVYGMKTYNVNEKNAYAQLLFETDITKMHNLSVGLSLNHDYLGQRVTGTNDGKTVVISNLQPKTDGHSYATITVKQKETTPGAYAQYTFNWDHRLTAMAGIRIDHSSVYGTFVTPRVHIKWHPSDIIGIRASVGKGYRTPFALAENNYLMASGRQLEVATDLKQEEAWNYGVSTALNIPLFGKTLTVNAEYYYTHFLQQAVIDYDSDNGRISIGNLDGKSYSHTFQIDANYEILRGLTLTAAYRRNIVKSTYGGQLMDKPLTSKYKGLVTASYKTPLGLWQFDATVQINGGGRMPTPYTQVDGTASWPTRYRAFEQVSAQITRWFRHFSVYIGGENLTGRRQHTLIYGAADAWGKTFEPTMVWGPVNGAMGYVGIRVNIGKKL